MAIEVKHVPDDIKRHYDNAVRAIGAGLPGPAVVELRKTLEGAASKFDIQERTLAKAITELINKGFVTKQFGDALHHVRFVGNQGAHFTDAEVSADQAQRVMSFTTQLLRNLFEVPGELAIAGKGAEEQEAEETPSGGEGVLEAAGASSDSSDPTGT